MGTEHIAQVQARIDDIRRRFPDIGRTQPAPVSSSPAVSFQDALEKVSSTRKVACPSDLEPIIAKAAEEHGVDPSVIKAVIRVESRFRNDAVSRVGARGLMQLMPGTARNMGIDPSDPAQNIDGGTKYLKQLIDRFGNIQDALAAYNAGPTSVTRYGGVPPYPETKRYVDEVMKNVALYSSDDRR